MTVIINDVVFEGNNVSIINGQIYIDGVLSDKKIEGVTKSSTIIVNGNLKSLDCVNCTINGDVLGDIEATNVTCRDVAGDIDAVNVTRG